MPCFSGWCPPCRPWRQYARHPDNGARSAVRALKFLQHRGHQVIVLHVMDPAELDLGGPAEARFEDPETGASVTLRPKDWAGAYRETVAGVVSAWRRSCRGSGMQYHQLTTDTPFGLALRRVLARPSGLA